MDLSSTLIRAESLFRRFQRTVEAIDLKHSYSTPPSVRQRKPDAASSEDTGTSSATARGKAPANGTKPTTGAEKERVISPELRALLSRKVEVLDKEEVRERGGGVGS